MGEPYAVVPSVPPDLPFPSLPVVVAGGFGALAVLWAGLQVLWSLPSRVDVTRPKRVLDHPVRDGIMKMLAGRHAMQDLATLRRDVAAAFHVSGMAAYFHVRTLVASHHLTVLRTGRRYYIGLNGGSMGSKEQRVAASLLHSELGFQVAKYICANPGTTQAALVHDLCGSEASPGTNERAKFPSRAAILRQLNKFEVIRITPQSDIGPLGGLRGSRSSSTSEDEVRLVHRWTDPDDWRFVRYTASPLLVLVVDVFAQDRARLGAGLAELTKSVAGQRPDGHQPARSG